MEISQLAEDIKAGVVPRRNARIGGLRCMYSHAVADRLLPEAENPAVHVPKPRRLPSARMALPDGRLSEISAVAAALAALTGEPHPLAPGTPQNDTSAPGLYNELI